MNRVKPSGDISVKFYKRLCGMYRVIGTYIADIYTPDNTNDDDMFSAHSKHMGCE